jgi:toxin HigB-1
MGHEKAVDLPFAPNAAKPLRDPSPLGSVGQHKTKGDWCRRSAMTLNDHWRVCFLFHDGHAYNLELTDYHKG